ncbi:PKD2 [Symbiodinium natans]|uniref:PKD2 protein n=1 Tax=Symbiodinium natans TaxID=878477 RepID=A0A812H7Z4_9DINO|nr:PKD2 [Symbiodinium natans]
MDAASAAAMKAATASAMWAPRSLQMPPRAHWRAAKVASPTRRGSVSQTGSGGGAEMITNAAGQADEDDFDGNLDQDPDTITEVEVARQRIRQLTHEQERAEDYQGRLSRKLQKLDADLVSKREEVEGLQRSLRLERDKFAEEYKSEKRERETKATTQEERIREYLTEVLYTKPKQVDKKGEFNLDTVLVSFVKPNESFRYNLAFRVDSGTNVEQLRNSACKYWGVSPDSFILRTMANNKCQDDNKVKDCFKQGEIAQLRLEMKRESAEPPLEEELKAIQPKTKKRTGRPKSGKPRFNAEGVEQIQKFGENYANQLKKMGGVYFLLKLRDTKPSEHSAKIKLRNLIVYATLVVLSVYVYMTRRPIGDAYWCAKGVQDYLLVSTPMPGVDPTSCTGESSLDRRLCVPSFQDIQTREGMWNWLNYTLPNTFWSTTGEGSLPTLASYNELLGYVSIRVQNVKTPNSTGSTEFCVQNQQLVQAMNAMLSREGANITCYPRAVTASTQETATYADIQTYWREAVAASSDLDASSKVRGIGNPAVFRSATENKDKHGIGSIAGYVADYDASGYSVDYRMTVSNAALSLPEYRKDLSFFRENKWIDDSATRMVVVSFTTYNFDYDLWTASDFLLELPPDGDVLPSFSVKPFKPRIYETRSELTYTYVEYVRLAIGIYILIFVGWSERHHKVRNHKAGFYYHISLAGITDLGLVTCMFVTLIWRTVEFQSSSTAAYLERAQDAGRTHGFYSFREMAWNYNTIFIVDGIVMVFLMYRMITFFRLSHTVFLQWRAVGQALKMFIFFAMIIVPAFAGFVVVSTMLFGRYIQGFSSLGLSAISSMKLVAGNLNPQVLNRDLVTAVISTVALYLLLTFFLMNVFVTIFVDAYYVVRLTSTQQAEKWDGQRIRTWALPGVCVSIFQAILSAGESESRD